jgi:glutathione S-transferase
VITLYQFDMSPFCDKVRRILNFKGQPFAIEEVSLVDVFKGKVKRISPVAKLPVIDHDGRVIWDSTDIALYLEEMFPEHPLIPSDPKLRAQVLMLEDWADESLYFYEVELRLCVRHNAQRWATELAKGDPAPLRTLAPTLIPIMMKQQTKAQGVGKKSLAQIEKELFRHCQTIQDYLAGGDFLVAAQLTLADIAIYCQMHCIQGSREGAAVLEEFPEVSTWMNRVGELTASNSNT